LVFAVTAKQVVVEGQLTAFRRFVTPDALVVHVVPPSVVPMIAPPPPTAMQVVVLAQLIE
jgi:hypothetical protein